MSTKCPKCNGLGELYHAPLTGRDGQYADEEWEACPTCGGEGQVQNGQCDLCEAEGPVMQLALRGPLGDDVVLTLCAECALDEKAREAA